MFKFYFMWVVMTIALVFSFRSFAYDIILQDGVTTDDLKKAGDMARELMADEKIKALKGKQDILDGKELLSLAEKQKKYNDESFLDGKELLHRAKTASLDKKIGSLKGRKDLLDGKELLRLAEKQKKYDAESILDGKELLYKARLEALDKKIESLKVNKGLLDGKELLRLAELESFTHRIKYLKDHKDNLDGKELRELAKKESDLKDMIAFGQIENDFDALNKRLEAEKKQKEKAKEDEDRKKAVITLGNFHDKKEIEEEKKKDNDKKANLDGKELLKLAEKEEKDCVDCEMKRRIGSLDIQIKELERALARAQGNKNEPREKASDDSAPYMATLEKYMAMFTTTMTKMVESQQAISQSIAAMAANMQNRSQMNDGIFQGIALGAMLMGNYRPQDATFNPYAQQYGSRESMIMDKYLAGPYFMQSRPDYGVPSFVFNNISNRS